ncbi:serine threonine kinase [Fusarium heterosporum]|uniref:Serine threonine kinase n=1 Tax=Fusarium heterosporum TaxID=42747 RepID=A0A8H5T0F8_FUSHE|nr:serine threonine kinase [Fusarium heterosporum]
MSHDISDSQSLEDIVHERTLPIIYPSTSSVAAQKPSTGTQVSGVTSRVSDYGRGVRQRNEAGVSPPPESRDSALLAGLEGSAISESLRRPTIINDEDLRDYPKLSFKTLINGALQLDRRNPEKRFLPCGSLMTICHHSAVREDLIDRGYDEHHAESYATYVCERPAREIFTVLVLINYVDFLPNFIDAGMVDKNLPFSGNDQQTELWYRESKVKRHAKFLNHPKDAEMMREFYNKQWWVHVPFLDWDNENHKALNFRFDSGTVLPWTEIGSRDDSGGFGTIEKVKIHQDHHSFIKYETFALKTMRTARSENDDRCFQQEISAFRKMKPGPHLVELCATLEITPSDNSMLLFPWADGGSLDSLMKKSRADLLGAFSLTEAQFVEWIAIQCQGLIDALGTIHDTRIKPLRINESGSQISQEKDFGIHGDIKPANILHFSQETSHFRLGNLKVADFGLITFHTRASRTRMNRATAYAASQTYRSPEHDISFFMSKKVDIWALGCVFSELMTWVILDTGRSELEDLRHHQQPQDFALAALLIVDIESRGVFTVQQESKDRLS